MTKFQFNKYGFNAYYPNELPNVRRCDGLWADVQGKPGFTWTTIKIQLKDCYGTVVYSGIEGKSKYKEYKKSYQDALRKAFEGIAALGVQQRPVDSSSKLEELDGQPDTPLLQEKVPEATAAAVSVNGNEFMPDAKFTSYTNNGINFLLRKTPSGYAFYQEVESAEDGLVLLGRIKVDGEKLEYMAENGEETQIRFGEDDTLELSTPDGTTIYRKQS